MSDLTERQEAIDALRAAYWDKNIQSAKDDPCIVDAMTDWAIRQTEALPPAQPEIVRCQDRKFRDAENGFCEGRGWPMQLVPDDGFCNKGKRSKA